MGLPAIPAPSPRHERGVHVPEEVANGSDAAVAVGYAPLAVVYPAGGQSSAAGGFMTIHFADGNARPSGFFFSLFFFFFFFCREKGTADNVRTDLDASSNGPSRG